MTAPTRSSCRAHPPSATPAASASGASSRSRAPDRARPAPRTAARRRAAVMSDHRDEDAPAAPCAPDPSLPRPAPAPLRFPRTRRSSRMLLRASVASSGGWTIARLSGSIAKRPPTMQQQERQDLRDRERAVHARAALDPQDVDRRKPRVDARRAPPPTRARDASAGTSAPRLAISTVATAAIANVSTIHSRNPRGTPRTARTRPRHRHTGRRSARRGSRPRPCKNDEAHREGAEQVGDERGRAERRRHVGRQPEDAAADRDVDDAGGERERCRWSDGVMTRATRCCQSSDEPSTHAAAVRFPQGGYRAACFRIQLRSG